MRVYLLRHAEAEPEAASDDLRELTDLGWAQAEAAADWLCGQIAGPVKLVCSPLLRARQTASVVQQTLGLGEPEQLEALVPEGDPLRAEQALSLILREQAEELVVVSHMPLIASLQSWIEEGILTTGEPFSLSEMRVIEADVLAPGLGRPAGRFLPDEGQGAIADLRALLARLAGES